MSIRLILYLISLSLFIGCSPQKENSNLITTTDDYGRSLSFTPNPQRLLALSPSMAEVLSFIVDEKRIIARTPNSDFPASIKSKQVIENYPKLDLEKIIRLKPDLIFTYSGMTNSNDINKLNELGIPVYEAHFNTLNSIFEGLHKYDSLLNGNNSFEKINQLKINVDDLKKESTGKDALYIISNQPIYTWGKNTLFTEKLKLLGLKNCIGNEFSDPYPVLNSEYILKKSPSIIFFNQSNDTAAFFTQYPELRKISAYKNNNIHFLTGNLQSRPSPRVVESIKEIASKID